ncbi:hypothetical protein, partial [Vibrio sp. PNB22_4_2]
ERIVCLRWVNFKSVLVGHFYIGADTSVRSEAEFRHKACLAPLFYATFCYKSDRGMKIIFSLKITPNLFGIK